MSEEPIRLLLVEDNPADARLLRELMVEANGVKFQLTHVERLAAGLDCLSKGKIDLILLDLSLPDSQGPDTLVRLQAGAPGVPIVVLTGLDDEALGLSLVQAGAQDYLVKGQVSSQLLAHSIRYAVERRRVEEALRDSEMRYRLLAQATFNAIWDWDLTSNEVTWNEGLQALFGYAPNEVEELFDWWTDRIHPDDKARVLAGLEALLDSEKQIWSDEYRFRYGSGAYAFVVNRGYIRRDSKGWPLRMIGAMLDLTEHKRLEEQFRQSQKMEAVGRLAGGIAHDFNNVLTIINGYSEMLRVGDFDNLDSVQDYLQQIIEAGQRAASLTHQLLTFSRKQELQAEALDLNKVVADMGTMLQRLIGEDIDLATILKEGLGQVRVDPGQLEQVILNLAVNARDAMPQGGKLTIETAGVELDAHFAHQHSSVKPGSYVLLAVSDTGTGMDQETLAHIFEPFFTTKEEGKGTGLGLATVYGIIKQSGGHIWVYSEVGRGTTFKVYLPREQVQLELPETSPAAVRPSKGSETILLVEDADGVRNLLNHLLEAEGYTVLAAGNGAEALQLCSRHSGPLHILITDVIMPGGMNGHELAEHLLLLYPNLKILYMSGYTDEAVVRHGVLTRGVTFLQKPFTLDALAHKIREILDSHIPAIT